LYRAGSRPIFREIMGCDPLRKWLTSCMTSKKMVRGKYNIYCDSISLFASERLEASCPQNFENWRTNTAIVQAGHSTISMSHWWTFSRTKRSIEAGHTDTYTPSLWCRCCAAVDKLPTPPPLLLLLRQIAHESATPRRCSAVNTSPEPSAQTKTRRRHGCSNWSYAPPKWPKLCRVTDRVSNCVHHHQFHRFILPYFHVKLQIYII